MKKFLMAATAMLSIYASSATALPENPFYVGTLWGDSTLSVEAKHHDGSNVPAVRDFEAKNSQSFSFMVMGGMRFTDWVGLELQYMTSLQKDQVFGAVHVNNGARSPMDLSMSAMGAYAVFQAGQDMYAKLRFGLGKADAKFETDFANATFSSPSLSYGLSIGQKMGSLGSVELMWMRYPDIKISRQKFLDDFGSTPPFEDYTIVNRRVAAQVLAVGYVFQF